MAWMGGGVVGHDGGSNMALVRVCVWGGGPEEEARQGGSGRDERRAVG